MEGGGGEGDPKVEVTSPAEVVGEGEGKVAGEFAVVVAGGGGGDGGGQVVEFGVQPGQGAAAIGEGGRSRGACRRRSQVGGGLAGGGLVVVQEPGEGMLTVMVGEGLGIQVQEVVQAPALFAVQW